jgi:hypothetical protein
MDDTVLKAGRELFERLLNAAGPGLLSAASESPTSESLERLIQAVADEVAKQRLCVDCRYTLAKAGLHPPTPRTQVGTFLGGPVFKPASDE